MIVVTGGAGFIGSNIVAGLNARGRSDILVVDDLRDGRKCLNLADLDFEDYMEFDEFLTCLQDVNQPWVIEAIFHQGACSDTTEWDGRYVMENNYRYSRSLLEYCTAREIPLIYASSASVYGGGEVFVEDRRNERPLNMYAFSKFAFDQYVRANSERLSGSQVVGLRYFNVYGPRETHKGKMSSVAFHFNNQIAETGECRLFQGSDGYPDGGQRRDFVYVGDVVDVNLWLFDNPGVSGIFNCGTGRSQTFADVADAVIAWHGKGSKHFIPFPQELVGRYQSFTQADLTALRAAGYEADFKTVEQAVPEYLDWLATQGG